MTHHGAVDFLRKGRILVTGSQTGLHMAHRDLMIESSQSACKGGRGIAMHQNQIGFCLFQHVFHPQQTLAGNGGQSLPRFHDVQIILRSNSEDLQNGIQHLTMLCGHAADALQPRTSLQFLDQRSHFNRFGTGSENGHNLLNAHPVHAPLPMTPAFFRCCP